MALALVAILAATGRCNSADFSARAVVRVLSISHSKRRSPPLVCRIYVRGKDERTECFGHYLGDPNRGRVAARLNMVHIDVWSKGIAWTLYTESRTYDVRSLKVDGHRRTVTQMKPVGKEVVDGHRCDVYKDETVLGRERVTTTYWWFPRLTFPIKTVTQSSSGTTVVELGDIRVGPVPASLFELPKGYKKRTVPPSRGERSERLHKAT